jgi:undecaprenyl diphosphate synthase
MGLLDLIFNLKAGKFTENIVGRMPLHIGIIPDGNGRWAARRGLPRSMGHRAGSNTLKRIVTYCDRIGLKYLTVYVFSTENWDRPQEEINTLMKLLHGYLQNAEKELAGTNVRIRIIGDIERLSPELRTQIPRVEELTKDNKGLTLFFALNYGGRSEILQAVRKIAEDAAASKINAKEINAEVFEKYLYTKGIPDPDLIIRTSGEMRTSNFLIWQSVYSEYLFLNIKWPDFTERDMAEAIKGYAKRNRRYGGI